jgi:hypothetical protein
LDSFAPLMLSLYEKKDFYSDGKMKGIRICENEISAERVVLDLCSLLLGHEGYSTGSQEDWLACVGFYSPGLDFPSGPVFVVFSKLLQLDDFCPLRNDFILFCSCFAGHLPWHDIIDSRNSLNLANKLSPTFLQFAEPHNSFLLLSSLVIGRVPDP